MSPCTFRLRRAPRWSAAFACALALMPWRQAAAQDDCVLAPARDSLVFLIGWRSTSTLVSAPRAGTKPLAPLPTDTLRGKLIGVTCLFGNTRPTVEVRGLRYQLDDLNLPIWSDNWKREFTGTMLLWRDGFLVPAAYLVANGRGALVDADSVRRASRVVPGGGTGPQLSAAQSAAIASRTQAFVDSIRRYDDSVQRAGARAYRDSVTWELAALRRELALPAATRPMHRWLTPPDTVPPGYTGDDLTSLIRRISANGQVESVDTSAWLAMSVDVAGVCGYLTTTYDPKAGELRINGSLARYAGPEGVMVPARCGGGVTGPRAGANGLRVTDRTAEFLGILLPGSPRLSFDTRLRLSAVAARTLSPRLRLVAFARPMRRPDGGLVSQSTQSIAATAATPINAKTTYVALDVRDLTLLAVDTGTGRVVAVLYPN